MRGTAVRGNDLSEQEGRVHVVSEGTVVGSPLRHALL